MTTTRNAGIVRCVCDRCQQGRKKCPKPEICFSDDAGQSDDRPIWRDARVAVLLVFVIIFSLWLCQGKP